MHLRSAFWIISVALLLAAGVVIAEEIHLRDGTKITGKIIGIKDDVFQVRTSYGDIQIPRGEVLSIGFPENQAKPVPAEREKEAQPIDESLSGARYINRTAKFELSLPEGWKLRPEVRAQSPDIAVAISSADGTLMLVVTPEQYSGSVNAYRALVEMNLKDHFGAYQKLSEASITLDGRKGIKFIWTGINREANDAFMKSNVVILPYAGRMMRLSFLSVESLFDEAQRVMSKILATYRSLNP